MHTLRCSWVQGKDLAAIKHMLRLSARVLWTGSNEIPIMLVTLLVVVLTFLRTCSVISPTFLFAKFQRPHFTKCFSGMTPDLTRVRLQGDYCKWMTLIRWSWKQIQSTDYFTAPWYTYYSTIYFKTPNFTPLIVWLRCVMYSYSNTEGNFSETDTVSYETIYSRLCTLTFARCSAVHMRLTR